MNSGHATTGTPSNDEVQEVLAAVFDQYAPALYRYAVRLCRDPIEADQIVGDVFARLLEQLTKGEGPRSNLRAYLYQATYHIVVDHARERQRTTPIDDTAKAIEAETDVQSQVEDQLLIDALSTAIDQDLTQEQRQVIVLRFQEELSLREVAEIMGKEVNAIKALQNRAVAKLKQSLSNQERT